jgi:selenocysteine-specific elongation factor
LRAFVVGTAGHVDHGKTALARALTGVDTDRWQEEKARGLTIDLGFAPLPLGADVDASLVDVPGHEDFVKNMLAGATGIDLLLLVVAADEGPMPQTREHLSIARLLGVRQGVVALSKSDRVDEGWLELCREAVAEELRQVLGHADWPTVPVSSTTGEGIETLRTAIAECAAELEDADTHDLFRLPVDRAFSVPGAGTVVTGTVWSGSVRLGEEVRVLPLGRSARVRSLQMHSAARGEVGARRRCALSLVGVDSVEVPRGSVIVSGLAWREVRRLGVRLSLLAHTHRRIERGQRVRVYLGTREVLARVRLEIGSPRAEAVESGQEAWAVLDLEDGLVARTGDRFVLRFYSPVVTIGGGLVVELEPPARWLDRTERWQRVLSAEEGERLEAAVALHGGVGASAAELPLATGLSPDRLDALAAKPEIDIAEVGGRWFAAQILAAGRRELLRVLETLHEAKPRLPGASREAVRSQLAGSFAPELIEHSLKELEAEGQIVAEGPEIRLTDHDPTLTPSETAARDRLLREIDGGGLAPPMVDQLRSQLRISDELLHDLLRLLVKGGDLESVSPEIYLSVGSAKQLRAAAERVFRERPVATPTDFKQQFGVTRRYLIPLLEYLDRTRVTRRTEEGRVWID